MSQDSCDAVHKVAENPEVLMRRKASVLLFRLRPPQHSCSPAVIDHMCNLETASAGAHVVHCNEVVSFPSDLCLCKIALAESKELVLEPILKVSYVLVDLR